MSTRPRRTDETAADLPPRAAELAAAVATGRPVALAARKLGVAARTARRWAGSPAFKQVVADLRAETFAEAAGFLKSATLRAVRRLDRLARSDDPEMARKAIDMLLSHCIRMSEHADLANQIAELREAFANANRGDR